MVDGIVLAAGFSRRMGLNKLLLPSKSGTVIEEVLKKAKSTRLQELILVYREESIGELGAKYGAKLVMNDHAERGQAESVKLGVAASSAEGYLFLAADQPFITAEFLESFISCFEETGKGIIAPVFEDEIKMPILFSSKYRQRLLQVEGDHGGYEILQNNPDDVEFLEVFDKKLVTDIDTMSDYQWLMNEEAGN